MIFNTYKCKDYKPDMLMKSLEKLKEKHIHKNIIIILKM